MNKQTSMVLYDKRKAVDSKRPKKPLKSLPMPLSDEQVEWAARRGHVAWLLSLIPTPGYEPQYEVRFDKRNPDGRVVQIA
jgi:hypothetical protein